VVRAEQVLHVVIVKLFLVEKCVSDFHCLSTFLGRYHFFSANPDLISEWVLSHLSNPSDQNRYPASWMPWQSRSWEEHPSQPRVFCHPSQPHAMMV